MTMKKETVNSKILTILICLLTLLPSAAKAQVGFDAVSIEAYIKDHKQQRSLLLVRSTLEASNKLLHATAAMPTLDSGTSTRNWISTPGHLM